jgi:hypothetical protein
VFASSDSELVVSFTSLSTDVCTVSSSGAITLVSAGDCEIAANQAGDDRYAEADEATVTFTVNKIDDAIALYVNGFRFPNAVRADSEGLTLLLEGVESTGAVTYETSDADVCAVVNGVLDVKASGNCVVTATVAEDARLGL